MILDYEQELTTASGQTFADGATGYGTKLYDMKAAGDTTNEIGQADAAIGEPLECLYMCSAASSAVSGVVISLIADTDGAGGSAVTLLTSANLVAATLTVALGVRSLGIVRPGLITKTLRYLTLRVVAAGSGGNTYLKAWLVKATDGIRANKAGIIG
jgi:hypothetical protein